MEDGGKDTGCGVALAKARFANEETKVQVGNSRSGFASVKLVFFLWRPRVLGKQSSGRTKLQEHEAEGVQRRFRFPQALGEDTGLSQVRGKDVFHAYLILARHPSSLPC